MVTPGLTSKQETYNEVHCNYFSLPTDIQVSSSSCSAPLQHDFTPVPGPQLAPPIPCSATFDACLPLVCSDCQFRLGRLGFRSGRGLQVKSRKDTGPVHAPDPLVLCVSLPCVFPPPFSSSC
eukprot:768673-Hanusia_phi.AAC.6